jgi:hypothetical protein
MDWIGPLLKKTRKAINYAGLMDYIGQLWILNNHRPKPVGLKYGLKVLIRIA